MHLYPSRTDSSPATQEQVRALVAGAKRAQGDAIGPDVGACHLSHCRPADVYAADIKGNSSAYPTGEMMPV